MHPVVVLEESRALYWDRNSEMTELGDCRPESVPQKPVMIPPLSPYPAIAVGGGEGSRWLDGRERMSIKSSSSEISMGTAEKCDVALARIRVGAKVGPVLLHRYRSQA
ncbi:hypothetical protein JHK86_027870 [Glycine max]|nr:hypothetical protein JHK86_027870 [Glycine max]